MNGPSGLAWLDRRGLLLPLRSKGGVRLKDKQVN
jgi:hypothetical protein